MKYLNLVIFVFILHVSIAVINAALVATGSSFSDLLSSNQFTTMQQSQTWLDSAQSEVQNDQYFTSPAFQGASGLGDYVQAAIATAKGIAMFIGLLAFGIVAVPYTFMIFGVPLILAAPLSLPIYVLYGLALAQFTSGRATKGMD